MATNGSLKRGNENTAGEIDAKKFKGQDGDTFTTLPYRDIPYEDQLKKKQGEIEQTFAAFGNQFKKKYPQYAQWYTKVFLETRFKIDNIQKSPKTLAYRNKCELTIGYNPDEGKLCAGPRIANSEDGKVQVGPCDKETLIHLPPSMVDIAQDFSNFLDKWNYLEEKCPWLNLFIRVTKGGDHMLMVMVVDGGLDVIKERKNELVKYYTDDYTLTHKVKSIFIQPRKENTGKKSFELDFLHAYGEEFLVEKLIDIQLIVTPSIFFRINTYAAEVLYQKTLNCADLKKRFTLVIDLWCGCGELSMLAAKRAQHVIAIDPSKWNIRKAQFMAKYNKIFNIDFIIAQPEDGLKQVWHQLPMAAEIVIIADPPTLCKMMALGDMVAEMTNLKRFIYLYSSHKLHLVKNMLSLTEASLLPTRVIPVDVAPHNVRLELIASMTKVDPNEAPPPLALEEALPSADYIEQIERRAFAMGMAKAMEAGAPVAPLVPVRPAIPSIMDEDYGFARRPLPEPEFGFGARRGGFGGPAIPAGRFGAYEPEYPSAVGFQASRGAGRYDDFDDEPPARFAGDAGRGGKNLKSVANNVAHNKFGGGGTPQKYGGGPGLGFRTGRGGFGASETPKKFGFGGGRSEYEDFSGYSGGYGDGAFGGARDRGFGAASRGEGGFGKDGFGRSGFSVETSFADAPSFSSGFGGAKGGFGERGSRGGYGDRGSRGGFGDRGSRGGFGDRGSRGGFGDRGSRGGFGGRGGPRGRGGR